MDLDHTVSDPGIIAVTNTNCISGKTDVNTTKDEKFHKKWVSTHSPTCIRLFYSLHICLHIQNRAKYR